jgi:hypothetical protein
MVTREQMIELAAQRMYEANHEFHDQIRRNAARDTITDLNLVYAERVPWPAANEYHKALYRKRAEAALDVFEELA